MPVRRVLENLGTSNGLDRAGLVLDDDPPALAFTELGGNDARDDVRRRARNARDDDVDDVRRVGLGADRRGYRDGAQQDPR